MVNTSACKRTMLDRRTILILLNWALATVFIATRLQPRSPSNRDDTSFSSELKRQLSGHVPLLKDATSITFNKDCSCKIPTNDSWTAQNGQDEYLFHRVFFQQALCCRGVFVEFGARNGIEDSNTYPYEKDMGWKGLMFEVDPKEFMGLEHNRPGAEIMRGPVCPSYMTNVSIALSEIPGWTGADHSMEPTRRDQTRNEVTYDCFHLATELHKRNMTRVDYMTIDTEGSELDIIEDFPWNDFDIRVVQIEQLVEHQYSAQRGQKGRMIKHMIQFGYKLLGVFQVTANDTDDLIFTRNIDEYLRMTEYMRGKHPQMRDNTLELSTAHVSGKFSSLKGVMHEKHEKMMGR